LPDCTSTSTPVEHLGRADDLPKLLGTLTTGEVAEAAENGFRSVSFPLWEKLEV